MQEKIEIFTVVPTGHQIKQNLSNQIIIELTCAYCIIALTGWAHCKGQFAFFQ